MYKIQVEKMSCGGCASRVTEATKAVDPADPIPGAGYFTLART
ncbi:heavy-metal-associated domain-containing protein [Oxalicibacterium solurbis]|uniref:Copper chaperone n=1 Tax=Oxalicibacterium solurbis TaxID=69280 RepID=A0A8J3F5L8_9BURK|nr:heavy-metal-associated domain-containing protein [Oxalicibacterium solurbis]GGI55667.1 hypothetical protein GCM10011430_28410 [Oxalicibacterium solurbis]